MAAVGVSSRRRTRTFTPSPQLIERTWRISPLLFVAIVVARWFEADRFIGAGDVAPMIRNGLAAEQGAFWNHQMTGAGATTADAGRVVEVFVIRATELLGGSELMAQRAMFIGVMVFACYGVSHLSRVVVDSRPAVAFAGLAGVFNPFVLLQLPNLIFPLAIGALSTLLGELLASLGGRSTTVPRLVMMSLPITFLSINPPLVAMIAGVVILVFGSSAIAIRPRWRSLRAPVFALPVVLAVHAFWILPAALVYGRGADGVTFAAVIDTQEWSWVYAENRLDRVATLTAHWGWFSPEYFPWSARLDGVPWSIMRWALPVGALLGGICARAELRRLGHALLAFAALLIVVSQGLHAPFGGFNQALYDHVPGWWLFRDPISKFGPLLVVTYALLFAMLIDRVADLGPAPRLRSLTMPGVAALALISVVHPWPLINGDVIASDRSTLPPSHVAVPDDWRDLAELVSDSAVDGKVAVLPLNDYYQLTTTWGYHGVDLAPQIFDRPVLQRLPGGYFGEVRGYDDLLEAVEARVLAGDGIAANRSLDALGASHLVIRRDLLEPAVDPADFVAGAERIDGLELAAANDVGWLFVRPHATTARTETYTVAATAGTEALAVARGLGAVVDPGVVSDRLLWTAASSRSVDMTLDSATVLVGLEAPERVDIRFDLVDGRVEGRLVDAITLDGVAVTDQVVITLDPNGERIDALGIGHERVSFVDGVVATVVVGDRVGLYRERREPVADRGELSNCNKTDDRSIAELDFTMEFDAESLTLAASEHSACVAYTLPPGNGPAQLSLTAEAIAGMPARACGWSESHQRCVVSILSDAVEPTVIVADISADERSGPIDLFVYADGGAEERTVNRYSDLTLASVDVLDSVEFELAGPLGEVETSGVGQVLEVDLARTNLLEPFGPVGDCHRVDDRTPDEIGLGGNVDGSTVMLWASAHTACVDASISAAGGATLLVGFDHSTSGPLPRLCVWQSTVDTCAPAPLVEAGQRYRAEIETDPAATALSLFLYADGTAEGTTVTFEDVSVVRSDAPRVVVETPGLDVVAPPTLETTDRAASTYVMQVGEVTDPFVLIVPESYAPGWELAGLPGDWSAEHLMVDGYANGWRIVPVSGGSAELTASYRPAELVDGANRLSSASLVSMWVFAVGRLGLRRVRRGRA